MNNKIETYKRAKMFSRVRGHDERTGEEKTILLVGNPEEFDKNFTKIFHAFTEKLISDEEMVGKAVRLLFWIMKELETGSLEFYMHPEEVAKEIGVTARTVRNWRNILEKKEIIKKVKPFIYMINPACIVKGKGHSLLEEFRQPSLFDDE